MVQSNQSGVTDETIRSWKVIKFLFCDLLLSVLRQLVSFSSGWLSLRVTALDLVLNRIGLQGCVENAGAEHIGEHF